MVQGIYTIVHTEIIKYHIDHNLIIHAHFGIYLPMMM